MLQNGIYQKNSLVRHMEKLCQEIGPRATGSAGNKAAVDYAGGDVSFFRL